MLYFLQLLKKYFLFIKLIGFEGANSICLYKISVWLFCLQMRRNQTTIPNFSAHKRTFILKHFIVTPQNSRKQVNFCTRRTRKYAVPLRPRERDRTRLSATRHSWLHSFSCYKNTELSFAETMLSNDDFSVSFHC